MAWFRRKRVSPPLHVSIQTRDANPVGVLGFAYDTAYFTPAPITGTGVNAGSYVQEAGMQVPVYQTSTLQQYGGLFSGVFAAQPLQSEDYVLGAGQ